MFMREPLHYALYPRRKTFSLPQDWFSGFIVSGTPIMVGTPRYHVVHQWKYAEVRKLLEAGKAWSARPPLFLALREKHGRLLVKPWSPSSLATTGGDWPPTTLQAFTVRIPVYLDCQSRRKRLEHHPNDFDRDCRLANCRDILSVNAATNQQGGNGG